MRNAWMPLALAAALAAGCATSPNTNLVNAETKLHAAEANPAVTAHAPVSLHEAQTSVAAARSSFEKGDDEARVDHLSYLAARRVEIAEAIAERNAAQQDVKQLSKERAGVVLDARTQEAEIAREDAAIAERQAQVSALTAAALAAELSALKAEQTERGIVVTLGDVLFDVGRAELKPSALDDLNRLADLLAKEPRRAVLIEGHTDSTGTAVYNDELSRQRANAVASVLTRRGVAPARLTTRGFGESSPLASNATSAGRQQNRRVEIVVLDATIPSVSERSP
ncbi:MAG: OmpA family protein [Myxococcota bacterium]